MCLPSSWQLRLLLAAIALVGLITTCVVGPTNVHHSATVADAKGLTGELLRLAGAPVPEGEQDVSACPVVVECAQWLLNGCCNLCCLGVVSRMLCVLASWSRYPSPSALLPSQ
jgi:hypothetical protein